MDTILYQLLLICILIPQILTSHAQTCSQHTFSEGQTFDSCRDLPALNAHLHWSYTPSTKSAHIAYRAAQDSTGWVAWAINPSGSGMAGSQAIVAFHCSNGSMIAYPTAITDYNPSMQPSALSFQVSNISSEYAKGEMTIFAVVGPFAKGSSVNHIWQAGDSVSNDIPQRHQTSGPNVQSMEKVDFASG